VTWEIEKRKMEDNIMYFEDHEYMPRRPRVDDFVKEYKEYLEYLVNIPKDIYEDPDRDCMKIIEISKEIWMDKLPEKENWRTEETWGTDQLGFSAPDIVK